MQCKIGRIKFSKNKNSKLKIYINWNCSFILQILSSLIFHRRENFFNYGIFGIYKKHNKLIKDIILWVNELLNNWMITKSIIQINNLYNV